MSTLKGPTKAQELPAALAEEFHLQATLGRGGFGVVYRAEQRSLARPVAIKLLTWELSVSPEFVARFVDEARLAARIDHPNVVKVYTSGTADGQAYIVYELVEGQSLSSLLESGPLPDTRAAAIAADVAAGLEALHQARVVHRDLKPENVLVGRDGRARLIDLGIARDLADRNHRTRTGMILGTPEYLSPEQIDQGALTAAVDVYAFGATLHAMLTGRSPFAGRSFADLLHAHVHEVPRLEPAGTPLERELRRIALACLAKAPAARPSASALARMLAQPPGDATQRSAVATVAVRRASAPRRAVGPVLAMVGLLIVLLALAARRQPAQPQRSPSPAAETSPRGSPESASRARERPLPEGSFWKGWSVIARFSPVLKGGGAQSLNPELTDSLARIAGRDTQVWRYWFELGEWLRRPGTAPPPRSHCTAVDEAVAILEEGELDSAFQNNVRRNGLDADVAVRLVCKAQRDGRSWLLLARILFEEGDLPGFRRVSGVALDLLKPSDMRMAHEVLWGSLAAALAVNEREPEPTMRRLLAKVKSAPRAWRGMRERLEDSAWVPTLRRILEDGARRGPSANHALMELANLEENLGAPERAFELLEDRLADRESAGVVMHQVFDMLRRRADLPALEELLAQHPHASWMRRWISVGRGETLTSPIEVPEEHIRASQIRACEALTILAAGKLDQVVQLAGREPLARFRHDDVEPWIALQLRAAGHRGPLTARFELPKLEDAPRAWLAAVDATAPVGDTWLEGELARERRGGTSPALEVVAALHAARRGKFAEALDRLPPDSTRPLQDRALDQAAAEVVLRPLLARLCGRDVAPEVAVRAAALAGAVWLEPLRPVAAAVVSGDIAAARAAAVQAFLARPRDTTRILLVAWLHHAPPRDQAARAVEQRALVAARLNLRGTAVLRELEELAGAR